MSSVDQLLFFSQSLRHCSVHGIAECSDVIIACYSSQRATSLAMSCPCPFESYESSTRVCTPFDSPCTWLTLIGALRTLFPAVLQFFRPSVHARCRPSLSRLGLVACQVDGRCALYRRMADVMRTDALMDRMVVKIFMRRLSCVHGEPSRADRKGQY